MRHFRTWKTQQCSLSHWPIKHYPLRRPLQCRNVTARRCARDQSVSPAAVMHEDRTRMQAKNHVEWVPRVSCAAACSGAYSTVQNSDCKRAALGCTRAFQLQPRPQWQARPMHTRNPTPHVPSSTQAASHRVGRRPEGGGGPSRRGEGVVKREEHAPPKGMRTPHCEQTFTRAKPCATPVLACRNAPWRRRCGRHRAPYNVAQPPSSWQGKPCMHV